MSSNVVAIYGGDLPPEQVLQFAMDAGMKSCVVIGWLHEPDPEDGKRFWVSSTFGSKESVIYAIQQANRIVLENCSASGEE
jgi:hypothetical protein